MPRVVRNPVVIGPNEKGDPIFLVAQFLLYNDTVFDTILIDESLSAASLSAATLTNFCPGAVKIEKVQLAYACHGGVQWPTTALGYPYIYSWQREVLSGGETTYNFLKSTISAAVETARLIIRSGTQPPEIGRDISVTPVAVTKVDLDALTERNCWMCGTGPYKVDSECPICGRKV